MASKALLKAFCLCVMFYASTDARYPNLRRAKRADQLPDACQTPPAPTHGNVECSFADALQLDVYCVFKCDQGYKFEGTKETDILFICDAAAGFYDDPKTPPCIPNCDPPCLNGGECTGPNTCLCVPPFYGDQCLHSRQLCEDPKPPRFGTMECQPDGNGGKICVPVCFPTFVFERPPPAQYVCGKDGTWSPDVNLVPDCSQEVEHTTTSAPRTTTVPKVVSEAMCGAWGTNHYRTFDNKVYTFEGRCRYTLVYMPNQYEIMVRNNPACSGSTCEKQIEIYQGGNRIFFHVGPNGPEIKWNDQVLEIPGFREGSVFEKVGGYITFASSLGYNIKWDGKQSVFVKVSDEVKGKVSGLCGRYNGNPADDFETQAGQVVTNVATFGSSWKKTEIGDDCPDVQQPPGCEKQSATVVQKADSMCNTIQTDPAFAPCHQTVDPAPFIESCKTDCCNAGSTESCMCATMEAYSRSCLDKGIKLTWRNPGRCEITCTDGKVYKECGSTCVKDCTNVNSVCTDPTCIDGCFCPDGQVLNNGKCIETNQCPCEHSGVQYVEGDVIPEKCNNCTCQSGTWSCTRKTCDKTCSATGDPHYETFDGKRYNFMGTCSYYLMKDRDFSIIVDNIQCGHGEASCTKSLSIDMNGLNIKLDHNHQLFINGIEITSLPYITPDIKVTMVSSLFMQATLSNGISILWDGRTRAYIKAPAEFMGKTIGLCGTFDGNQNNDFKTLEGNVETNPNVFGNNWKTESSCADMPTTIQTDPCDANPQRKDQAIQLCSQLKSDIFRPCFNVEDVTAYYEDCVYDLCSCTENMKDCMCPNIGSYADTCATKGVKINWRLQIPECILQCPAGQEYTVCSKPCERTCRDIAENNDDLCDAKCVEGCNCPPGQTLNDQSQCVPMSECPCIFDGRTYPAGYTTLKGNEICVCDGGKFSCSKITINTAENLVNAKNICQNDSVYTDCASNCPPTCENMAAPPTCSSANCKAGCDCISGYVLDGDKCVNSSLCPCHHAGKPYYEGETYFQDCNECTCVGRRWQCTQRNCPSICSSYGDSHYTTFDGVPYEFQGACDYVLVQSTQDSPYKYVITTRNAQCGTQGVTCFKQLEFVVGTEGTDNFYRLQLIRGQSVVPEPGSPFTVKEIGDMVYITTPFGVTLQWDKGTRVYVRLSTEHMDHVEGLCGNFNKDQTDDFVPRQGGPPLVSATSFGDSWKMQTSCAPSTDITDTCLKSPQRKAWAQQKCAVIKSDLFAPCHNFVDMTKFVRRCEFDTCGCDLGGDCECLCTAIAAYAHECAINGISIKWRSHDLCPMQCESCEEFNPCISLCPKKTCDNRLVYGVIEKQCDDFKGICFEGCDLHPCPPGQVYDSLAEPVTCIPETLCETTACDINGKKYREGERVEDTSICRTECEICICRGGYLDHITFGNCEPIDHNTPPPVIVQTTAPPNIGDSTPHFNVVTNKGIFFPGRR